MRSVISLACLVSLSACTEQMEMRSVDWFKKHPTDRERTLAMCSDRDRKSAISPNCLNAQAAENQLANARRAYAPLTPMGADPKEKD